jgi:hypothetical protein
MKELAAAASSGNVTFKADDSAITGCDPLTLSNAQASCTTSALAAGSHAITVEYAGDASYLPSVSTTLVQVVNRHATSTALEAAPNPSKPGQSVVFTATIAQTALSQQATDGTASDAASDAASEGVDGVTDDMPAPVDASVYVAPAPSGTVIFAENGAAFGRAQITDGVATLTTAAISVGDHSITAEYVGDGAFRR